MAEAAPLAPESGQLIDPEASPHPHPQNTPRQTGFAWLRTKLVQLVSSGFPPLCILFQVFRLGSLVMFAIFVVDCTLYHDATSVDCTNFTVYSTPSRAEFNQPFRIDSDAVLHMNLIHRIRFGSCENTDQTGVTGFAWLRTILVQLVSCGFPPLCILFQVFRLGSLVMFAIFVVDCTLYHDATSVDCTNFTVYIIPKCDPYCWKTVWLVCSISTSTVWICLLNRTLLLELRPVNNKTILKCLVRKPYFWSLNTITALVVLYDVLIMVQNENAKIPVECLVVVSKLLTVYLLYQLNFTFPPCRRRNFRPISRAAYCITLSIYVLDNLCKVLVVSAQVAFKFYTVNHNLPKPMTIINLMLMIVNASLYHSFLQFFWQKLFRGDKDILKVFKQKSVDITGIKENIKNDDPV